MILYSRNVKHIWQFKLKDYRQNHSLQNPAESSLQSCDFVTSAAVVVVENNMAEKWNLTLQQAPPIYQLLCKSALTLTQNFALQTRFRDKYTLLEENSCDSGKITQPFFLCMHSQKVETRVCIFWCGLEDIVIRVIILRKYSSEHSEGAIAIGKGLIGFKRHSSYI